jgi:F-type H+-transporting ATPase subunit c
METRNRTLRLLFVLATVLVATAALAPAFAQEGGAPDIGAAAAVGMYAKFGAAIGAGMVVIGAGLGIGKFAAAAADGVARQPQAAAAITGAVQLPLFLLEGVAIIGVVTCLLISFS